MRQEEIDLKVVHLHPHSERPEDQRTAALLAVYRACVTALRRRRATT